MSKTFNSLDELIILKNNTVEYKGGLYKYQQQGSKLKQKYSKLLRKQESKDTLYRLTSYQDMLYKRAIYGLNMYTNKEQKGMHWERKRRINHVYRKAQRSINVMKQERVNVMCDRLYAIVFPKSNLAKDIFSLEKSSTDSKIINNLDLDFLGIKKEHVVKRLIADEVLPKDFFNLKKAG